METSKKFVGQRFGFVVVLEVTDPGKGRVTVQCDCGAKVERNIYTIVRNDKAGYTISCGCKRSYGFTKENSYASRKVGGTQATCKRCGESFKHYANRQNQAYCGRACYDLTRAEVRQAKKAELAILISERRKAREESRLRNCLWCGAKTKKPSYCSKDCSIKGTGRKTESLACGFCGKQYMGNKGQKYCCKRCRTKDYFRSNLGLLNFEKRLARKAAKKRHKIKRRRITRSGKVTRADIVLAYGNVCHLCNTTIDLSKTFPDPWCFSMDHIEPICRLGDHTIENIRPAHLICNSRRGNKPIDSKVDTMPPKGWLFAF